MKARPRQKKIEGIHTSLAPALRFLRSRSCIPQQRKKRKRTRAPRTEPMTMPISWPRVRGVEVADVTGMAEAEDDAAGDDVGVDEDVDEAEGVDEGTKDVDGADGVAEEEGIA